MRWTRARTGHSSPKMRIVSAPSRMRRPSVCSAWKPTNRTALRRSTAWCFRWCRMRPPSHMPDDEMITAEAVRLFSARLSFASPTNEVLPLWNSGPQHVRNSRASSS